jgi:hypothetical protein
MLNDLGGLGWELVAIVDTGAGPTAVFKRPSTRVLGDFEGSWPVE